MGYIRHNALIATCWSANAVNALVTYAESLGCEVLHGDKVMNGYRTVCITPDGGEEGWESSDDGDERRKKIKGWFASHPKWYFEWCEVAYGCDDGEASITDDAWRRPESTEQPNTEIKPSHDAGSA